MCSAKVELLAGALGQQHRTLCPSPPRKVAPCLCNSLRTCRKQPAPSGLKIAEHYGHTLVFEGKTCEVSVAIKEAKKVTHSLLSFRADVTGVPSPGALGGWYVEVAVCDGYFFFSEFD